MRDLFFSFVELVCHLAQQTSHGFFSVKHVSSLFVAFDVVFDFFLKVLINTLIFKDAQQTFVDFTVKDLVLVCKLQMIFS